jgi:hypothetical protein
MVQIISTSITEETTMMKKLILVASLCIAASVLAPVASASAEKFKGSCVIKGSAEFAPNLKFEPQTGLEYKFKGSAECVVVVEGVPEVLKGSVEVEGKFGSGVNACLQAKSDCQPAKAK